jgi:hypothetical protein
MKVEVKEAKKTFKPVTVEVTFEDREELFGHDVGFITRMDTYGFNLLSTDPTCRAIRKALKEAGY